MALLLLSTIDRNHEFSGEQRFPTFRGLDICDMRSQINRESHINVSLGMLMCCLCENYCKFECKIIENVVSQRQIFLASSAEIASARASALVAWRKMRAIFPVGATR